MRTYNLFLRIARAELVCAVPQDRPVPAFITGATWKFGGKLENAGLDPFAFNQNAADVSVRVNGFYLFQLTKPLAVSFPVQQRPGPRRASAVRAEGARARDTARSQPPEERWP